jgi:glycosyltransferase involved in cell wall biosynthesis
MNAISIIIPLFNKQKYILNVLEVLIDQIHEHDEIVVIDDKSTDGSYESVVNLFKEHSKNCKLYRHEVNSGPATARNFGIDVSSKPYIFFFDADDIPLPGMINALHKAINNHSVNKVFAFNISRQSRREFSNFILSSEDAIVVRSPHSYATDYLKGSLLLHPSCTLISRDVLKKFRFIDGLRYCEDPELWVRISSQYEIIQILNTYSIYRDVAASLSYIERVKVGATNHYVNTLVSLSEIYGDLYKDVAISILMKNFVFSKAAGASFSSLENQFLLYKNLIGIHRVAGWSFLNLFPKFIFRFVLNLIYFKRLLLNGFFGIKRKQSDGT